MKAKATREKLEEESSKQIYRPILKRGSFEFFHSDNLNQTFILEASFPSVETCRAVFEDNIISLLPNFPCCNYDYFHEALVVKGLFSKLKHFKERDCIVPLQTNGLTTSFCKREGEEEVHSGFFTV